MRKHTVRGLSLLLTAILAISCLGIFASATEAEETMSYVKGANFASESYIAGKYYKNLTSLPLTGDNVTDLLAVALSQVGYMEGDTLYDMDGTVAGSNNFTEYNWNMGDFGVGYGTGNYDWCASFVSFCLLQSRCTEQNKLSDWCRNHMGDPEYIWREVGCPKWAQNLEQTGYFQKSAANGGNYTPKSGDLIFFRWSPEKAIGHVGVVLYADAERVYTVEGNTNGGSTMVANGGAVHFKSYELSYSCIEGYGTPPYKTNDEVTKIDYSGENATTGLYITTTLKKLYAEPSLEGDYAELPAGTLFETIEVVEAGLGGLLKVVCDIDGEETYGYIVNDAGERVIQMSTTVPPETPISFRPFDMTDGFLGGEISGYLNSGEAHDGDNMEVEQEGSISLRGWFGYDRDIIAAGYYLDGNREKIMWISDALLDASPSDEQVEKGGEKVRLCEIDAELLDLSLGAHSITFLLKLEGGVIPIIETVDFTVIEKQEEPTDAPTEAPTETPTEAPTDKPTDKPTEAPSESGTAETDAPTEQSGGCASALGASAAVLSLVSALLVFKRKREE